MLAVVLYDYSTIIYINHTLYSTKLFLNHRDIQFNFKVKDKLINIILKFKVHLKHHRVLWICTFFTIGNIVWYLHKMDIRAFFVYYWQIIVWSEQAANNFFIYRHWGWVMKWQCTDILLAINISLYTDTIII